MYRNPVSSQITARPVFPPNNKYTILLSGKWFRGTTTERADRSRVTCAWFSEVRMLSVDEEAEGGQRRSQLGGLAAGRRQEGVVLQLLEGLQRERGERK